MLKCSKMKLWYEVKGTFAFARRMGKYGCMGGEGVDSIEKVKGR